MTTLLASLILLAHAPIVQGPGGPGAGSAGQPWSPEPDSITASIVEGPTINTKSGGIFSTTVSMKDRDTIREQSISPPYDYVLNVYGEARLLVASPGPYNGQVGADDNAMTPFTLLGTTEPVNSAGEVQKSYGYQESGGNGLPHPYSAVFTYTVHDTAPAWTTSNPHSIRDVDDQTTSVRVIVSAQ